MLNCEETVKIYLWRDLIRDFPQGLSRTRIIKRLSE